MNKVLDWGIALCCISTGFQSLADGNYEVAVWAFLALSQTYYCLKED